MKTRLLSAYIIFLVFFIGSVDGQNERDKGLLDSQEPGAIIYGNGGI